VENTCPAKGVIFKRGKDFPQLCLVQSASLLFLNSDWSVPADLTGPYWQHSFSLVETFLDLDWSIPETICLID
jgi:hypothetical protein